MIWRYVKLYDQSKEMVNCERCGVSIYELEVEQIKLITENTKNIIIYCENCKFGILRELDETRNIGK